MTLEQDRSAVRLIMLTLSPLLSLFKGKGVEFVRAEGVERKFFKKLQLYTSSPSGRICKITLSPLLMCQMSPGDDQAAPVPTGATGLTSNTYI